MPPKKPPITAEGLRVFLDHPIEGVRVIRSSNGIYQADRKYFCWRPSFYGGSSGAADDDREAVSVRGVQQVYVRVKCTDPRNAPANFLDLAQELALKVLKVPQWSPRLLLAIRALPQQRLPWQRLPWRRSPRYSPPKQLGPADLCKSYPTHTPR